MTTEQYKEMLEYFADQERYKILDFMAKNEPSDVNLHSTVDAMTIVF